jgi:hypothetical protein
MCKKSAKTDKAKIREIQAPHLQQRGPGCSVKLYLFFSFWANKLSFFVKLSPIVKSELKVRETRSHSGFYDLLLITYMFMLWAQVSLGLLLFT